MTTAKQTAANRRNAQRSTGPKTTAGKAASSRNALLLPGESRRAFRRLFRSFLAEYHPSGPLQEFLVEQLAIAYWKLSRLTRIEAHVYRQPPTTNTNLLRQLREALLARHDDDNDDHNGDPEPESPQPALTPDEAIARTYLRDSAGPNTLAHLSYYEMRLERTFFRAWRELHRLQAKSPPAS